MPRGRKKADGNGGEATIGHNSAGLTEDQFFEAKREIESLERQKNSIVGQLREARKSWKGRGLHLKVFDAMRVLTTYTQVELKTRLNDTILYARFLRLPVYSQLDLFQEVGDLTDEDRIYEARSRGLVAGKSGAARESPWPSENVLGAAWLAAYDDGATKARATA